MLGQKDLSSLILFAHLRLSWSYGRGPCNAIDGPWCVGVRGQLMEGQGLLAGRRIMEESHPVLL